MTSTSGPPTASDVSRCTLLLAAEQGLLSVVAAVQFRCIMRLEPSQRRASIRGQQVYLSLLAILLSHLLLMATPLHDVVLLGHRAPDEAIAAHAVHAAPGDCVELTATGAHHGSDCAILGAAPPALGTEPPARVRSRGPIRAATAGRASVRDAGAFRAAPAP